ncbi:DUF924 domain-containing protein [Hylemonella gracilis]|jgi:uncharacterized protein (DUF924 family)|uniref:DUF924 domain-containing protein n=1 Tax=Hylemonella gracilis TaxID=80880 RepID=A0A4P6ULI5_9BURK|nr:DUF924 family protein [Hylemonella gracilis]QBK06062.1 DUF924 domain-containing protein [Hylemonella gracilis]
MTPHDILAFWFEELNPKQHFSKDAALDACMRERFGALLETAAAGGLPAWRMDAPGHLAEIILLDQFSRNIHRDTPGAFAQDALALRLARELVAQGGDRALPLARRVFAYMPYMHSEDLAAHTEALPLFSQAGLEENLRFLRLHTAIIARFGRYPHRNAVLGRASTPEELAFLQEPGSSF